MCSQAYLKMLFLSLFTTLFVLANGFLTNAIAKDPIEVTRDKERTTYSIGHSDKKSNEKTEEEKDKERAWDMLRNMNTVIDQRRWDGKQNGQPGGK